MGADDEAALTFSRAASVENDSRRREGGGGGVRRGRKAEKIEISRDFPSCFSSPKQRGLDRREPNRSSFDTVHTLFYFGDKTLTPPTHYTHAHTHCVMPRYHGYSPARLDVLCEMLLGVFIYCCPSIVLNQSAHSDL